MKKRIMNLVLALTLVVAGTFGATNYAEANTEVATEDSTKDPYLWKTFTYKGDSDTNFEPKLNDEFKQYTNVMPGDTIIYHIKYVNGTDKAANFYMNAEVVKSLEEASKEVGGAYSYVISNNGTELVSSKTVGGDATSKLGLTQISGDTGIYFDLGEVKPGDESTNYGTVSVEITLDGDTQANVYMDKTAELQFYFRAETETVENKVIEKENIVTHTTTNVVKQSEKKTVVRKPTLTLDNSNENELVEIDEGQIPLAGETDIFEDSIVASNPLTGDSIFPLIACGLTFISGLALILYYIKLKIDKKKEVA